MNVHPVAREGPAPGVLAVHGCRGRDRRAPQSTVECVLAALESIDGVMGEDRIDPKLSCDRYKELLFGRLDARR